MSNKQMKLSLVIHMIRTNNSQQAVKFSLVQGTASFGHFNWLMMEWQGRPHLPNLSRESSGWERQPISWEVTFGKGREVSCLGAWRGGSFRDCVELFSELFRVTTPASSAFCLIYSQRIGEWLLEVCKIWPSLKPVKVSWLVECHLMNFASLLHIAYNAQISLAR